ncbi:GT-D fold domain-containing protein [Paenibacillus sp. FSL H8-0034]|uniref:GT-D fold domain-containing protein n=1 Tax=Paenibacillus sp. FSL H8-0034 TaxID=2954671 RepID=UPI0030F6A65B
MKIKVKRKVGKQPAGGKTSAYGKQLRGTHKSTFKLKRKPGGKRSKDLNKTGRRTLNRGKADNTKRFRPSIVNQMLDESHSKGYQSGYQDGQSKNSNSLIHERIHEQSYNQGHRDGHKEGLYAGGDGIVDSLLPFDAILPEISIRHIIEAGIGQLHSQFFILQTAEQITHRLRHALDTKTPFSLVRIGDGEVLTMAQETILSIDQVKEEGKFLSYAGVDVPDLAARDQLISSLRQATVVGIPKLRNFTYQPMAFQALRAHGVDYHTLSLTHSLVNYYIFKEGRLAGLLRGSRILLVGNMAETLSTVLTEQGMTVSGIVTPVHGVRDIPRVMAEVSRHDFDLALISAGVSAVTIAQRIATEMGKVAIDFGHLADELATRKETLC